MSKKLILKKSGASSNQKEVFKETKSQNIWD